MIVRLTHLDGKLPNLAIMKLSSWHKARGDRVVFTRKIERELFEPEQYDIVYGSTIFSMSAGRVERFTSAWPNAVVGGTGCGCSITVEDVVGGPWEHYDYEPYPHFPHSIGFTQRGCRLKCKFCVVPDKEGKPRAVNSIEDIWRGDPHPRNLHILDNDFFGQPNADWIARVDEIRSGGFRVAFTQGINIRLIDDAAAEALASIEYRDGSFNRRRLYTAWDNLKDEKIFFRGIERLARAGVPPRHVMAYMLVGFAQDETWDRILYRFDRMVATGIKPYPMVYGDRPDLKRFQRWAVRGLYRCVPWREYDASTRAWRRKERASTGDLLSEVGVP